MVALPAATPATFTPCSTPHIQVGREPTNAIVSWSRPSISTCVARVVVSRRGANRSTTCVSLGGRSEFFAKSVQSSAVAGYSATRQSHTRATLSPAPRLPYPRGMARRTVSIVPHTHWDREWYSPFQTFRLRLVDLLDD